jgi:hypothetical protein
MPTIPRHIVAAISGLLLGLIAAVLAAPTAFAHRPPDEGNSGGLTAVDVPPAQITVHHSSPLWVFVLVALVAIAGTIIVQ